MNIKLPQYFTDERDLAKACAEDIGNAQQTLYRQYAKKLMVICIRYVSCDEDAKELLADTFIAAFKNISRFNYMGTGSLFAWLKKIAINQCLMHLRKNKMRFEAIQEIYEERYEENDSVLAQMNVREILFLIHNLPPGYRAVFNLYVFEEMQHKEIAALLNISESTSKSQLHKARQLLQKQFTKSNKEIL